VSFQKPAQVEARAELLTMLGLWLEAVAPEEGCALLVGIRLGACWRLERLWPCCNVWPDGAQRNQRFAIDPREQLQAQKWARGLGLELLGSAHSHPTTAPLPSASDRAFTVPPALMLIRGIRPAGERPETLCWWLDDGEGPPELLPCRQPAQD
jgi:proteasome lid subunit RPN8/RPN11